jgi:hypothetical protein
VGAVRLTPAVCAVLVGCVALGALGARGAQPEFDARISRIGPRLAERMTGVSWRPGCPVPLSGLRVLALRHWDMDGRVRTGRLVAAAEQAPRLVRVFRRLFASRFPIRRMRLVDAYGGDDFRSIEADNTSAFNCRAATGSARWSEHAYGRAIDVNPIENPYVAGGRTSHPASVPFLDRSVYRRGMAIAGGVVVEAFLDEGWGWGGAWAGPVKDYQHFSASGR